MNAKLLAIIIAISFIPRSSWAEPTDTPDLSRFHIEGELTKERMEYFIAHPPTTEEYRALTAIGYGMDKIACYLAENHPDKIDDVFPIDLYRWTPRCTAWSLEEKVPEVKPLLEQYWKMSGILNMCGTIYRDIGASISSFLVSAGALPLYGEDTIKEVEETGVETPNFLILWATQGIWEKEQLTALQNLEQAALQAMSAYYRKQFGLTPKQAQTSAAHYLLQMRGRFLERFPNCAYRTSISLNAVRGFLKNKDFAILDKQVEGCMTYDATYTPHNLKLSHNQWLASMLRTAVVEHLPMEEIKTLFNLLEKPIPPDLLKDAVQQSAPYYTEALAFFLASLPDTASLQNSFGKTALMYAVQYRNTEAMALLLSAGADVNLATFVPLNLQEGGSCDGYHAMSAHHRTPLIYAAWQARQEIVDILLKSGADISIKDSNGITACDYINRNVSISPEEKEQMNNLLCVNTKE